MQVAPQASLLSYRISKTGEGTVNDFTSALNKALEDEVDIIKISFYAGLNEAPDNVEIDILTQLIDKGIVIVSSAGNFGPNPWTIISPAISSNVIAVGATTKQDRIADFSSRGPELGSWGIKPDLVAPEEQIYSFVSHESIFGESSGTSLAAPQVTSAVALLKQQHPKWTPSNFKVALAGYDFIFK